MWSVAVLEKLRLADEFQLSLLNQGLELATLTDKETLDLKQTIGMWRSGQGGERINGTKVH